MDKINAFTVLTEVKQEIRSIIDNIKMIKDNGYGLYMLDKELGSRVYSTPSPLAGKE